MSSDLGVVVGLALLAMLNPSLVAATTVMLLVPRPKSLMLSYLLGAYTTAMTVGLVIVFTLQGSSFASTAKRTVSPAEQIAVGAILLLVAFILQTKRDAPARGRRRRKEAKARASEARAAGRAPARPRVDRRCLRRGGPVELPGRLLPDRAGTHREGRPGDRADDPSRCRLLPDPADPARATAARLCLRARADGACDCV